MSKAAQPETMTKLKSRRTKSSLLFREACEQLRQHLTALGPGVALSEISLSEQLGISRTPVREALIQLSNEGLVQFRGNGRCHVATFTKQDVVEICDVRIGLEATAARSLATSITQDQLTNLRKLAIEADRAEKASRSRAEWDQAEEAFHRRLLEYAGNSRILELLERQGILERLLTVPLKNWRHRQRPEAPWHTDVVDALASRDPDLCDRVLRAHTGVRKQYLLKSITTFESEAGD